MAVIITNMDMPKCCKDCIFWNYYEGNCRKIKFSEWKDFDTDEEYEKRAYGCPLKSAVEHKPILDKIRAEIIEKYWDCDICKYNGHFNIKGDINDVLQIIDKYKAESEGE